MDITKKVTKITYNGVNLPLDSGTPTPEPTDPVYVYKSQRNTEWLNMLGSGYGENYNEMESYYDTADNEIRLLFHLTPPADNLIAFNVTTSSGQYNVSYYDKNDNLISVDVDNYTKFEANLMYDDFKHEMSDGTRQVLIVITPTTIGNNLLTFTPAENSLKTISGYMNWTIVEMMGKTTSGTNITPSGSVQTNRQFSSLEFYTLFGTNLVTSMENMFCNCHSLTAIPQLDTSLVTTSMVQMFSGCSSLTAIPQLNTSSVKEMLQMFQNCTSLTTIPQLNTSSVENMVQMFQNCTSLTTIPQLNTSSVKEMLQMFQNCTSLTTIPQLNTSSVENMVQMFQNCTSLTTIPQLDTSSVTGPYTGMNYMFNNTQNLKTLTITATDWAGISFSITQCSLGYQALLNLLGSLPLVSGTPTLTATNNIGTAQLKAEVLGETPPAEYTQAVSRGWTIAL